VRFSHMTAAGIGVDAHYQRLHGERKYTNRPGGQGFQPLVHTESDFAGNADTLQALVTMGVGPRVVFSAGYELERETYDGQQRELGDAGAAFDAGTRISQDAHALLARLSLTPADRTHVAGSVRVQGFSLDRPVFSPAGTPSAYDGVAFDAPPTAVTGDLAVSYGVARETKLRLHVGNAYRAPSLYERFGGGFSANPATGLVSFTPYGDPRLEPDRYVSIDAGVDQGVAAGRGRLRATWFHTWVEQLTEFQFGGAIDPETDPYGRFAGYLNGDGGRSRGLELESDWRIAALTFSSAYTFTDSKTDKALIVAGFFRTPAVARHTFAVTALQRVGPHLELVTDLFARSSTYAGFFTALGNRAYEFPSVVKLDVGAAWLWRLERGRQVRAQAKIDNILDRRYYEIGWLAPGARLQAGVTYTY
jgi:vitamin B12 transporter